MVRIGLIGCGEHAEIGHAIPLARYLHTAPDLELSAVCDLRRERAEHFRNTYGFRRSYSDAEEMLSQEKLDACIAVLPVERIASFGIGLLERGLRCSLEKPLGASLLEVRALAEAAQRSGTQNMVSVNRRFMPFLNRAIEWTHDAGELRYVRATMTRHNRTEHDFLTTTAVHAVDAVRHITGEIKQAQITSLSSSATKSSWFAIDLEFESGVRGRVDVLPTAGMLEESYELIGEGYRAIVTAPFGPMRGLRCYRGNTLVLSESDEGIPEDIVFGFYDEAVAFVNAIRCGKPLRPSVEDIVPSVEVCWQLAESLKL